MRRADVVSGSAFKVAALAVAIVAVGFVVAGWIVYTAISNTMLLELKREFAEEVLLFAEVDETDGERGLIQAVGKLEAPEIAGERFVALVSLDGRRLAGNFEVTPAFRHLTSKVELLQTRDGRRIAASSARFENVQLVVGRDAALIDATLGAVIFALLAGFLVIAIAVMIAGWVLSKRSLNKLKRISETLERVGGGDTTARIGPLGSDGQIDRVAQLIDVSLGRLAKLTESSQNTIRAIAHDLRTPLNRTLIRLEAAVAAPADKRDGLLSDVRQELDHLGAVFDTVLRISTLETSFNYDTFSEVDLAAMIAETVALFEPEFAAKRQQVRIVTEPSAIVRGDDQAMRQLLANLLANANRHTGEGTRIEVLARHDAGETILSVCDSGPGIEQSQREFVLKPFARLDSSGSTPGSGLGLALVNAIAIRHGAIVELSDNAPGLCVRVRFPD